MATWQGRYYNEQQLNFSALAGSSKVKRCIQDKNVTAEMNIQVIIKVNNPWQERVASPAERPQLDPRSN